MSVSVKLQIQHTIKILNTKEKTPQNIFHRGTRHCENWIFWYTNIYQIFAKYFYNQTIESQFLGVYIQLLPKKSHPSCSLFEL